MTRDHAYHGADIALDRGDDWRDWAACRGEDSETFFPYPAQSAEPAKAICARCSVRETCLDWAIDNRIDHGVWGGHTVKERNRIRRKRSRA